MSLTIILSGPAATSSQAQAALTAAGLRVISTEAQHGLPATADGSEPEQPQQTVTTIGEPGQDHGIALLDAAVSAVQEHGWVLRMHHETPPPPEPTQAERIAELEARLAALESRS